MIGNKTKHLLSAAAFSLAILFSAVTDISGAESAKPVLKIGYLPITDHLTIITKDRKTFSEFELQPVKFSGWAEISEALKAGAVDGAFLLSPIGITLKSKNAPIKAVLLGHRNGSVITVKSSEKINDFKDLSGKTVAIPSRFSTHNILLRKKSSDAGINADEKIRIIEMAPPEMVNALAVGRIDAFIVAEPFGAQAEIQKVGRVLAFSKDIWPDHICCVLNLNEKLTEKHPKAVQELVSALVETGDFIEKHHDDAAKLSQKFLGQKPEVVRYVLTTPEGRVTYGNLIPDLKDFEKTQDYMLQFGLTKERIDLKNYIDDSFARKAYGK